MAPPGNDPDGAVVNDGVVVGSLRHDGTVAFNASLKQLFIGPL